MSYGLPSATAHRKFRSFSHAASWHPPQCGSDKRRINLTFLHRASAVILRHFRSCLVCRLCVSVQLVVFARVVASSRSFIDRQAADAVAEKKCSNLDPHFKSECVPVFKFRSKFGPQLGAAWRHQKCGGSCDDSTVVFCRCITNLRLSRASKYFCIPCSFRFPALIRGVFELVSS